MHKTSQSMSFKMLYLKLSNQIGQTKYQGPIKKTFDRKPPQQVELFRKLWPKLCYRIDPRCVL